MQSEEFYEHLTKDIIPFWNRMKDETNGGFFGFADADAIPDPNADKGVLLICRILWFYSAAYLFLKSEESGLSESSAQKSEAKPESAEPLFEMADHAYRFFIDHCLDHDCGGVYWTVKADGSPADTTKYTYNMAFAIYALSAYYRAKEDPEALDTAFALFHMIETTCKDEKGYLEAFDKHFVPVRNDELSENGIVADRTMNTLLHAMESYTEFYRITQSEEVRTVLIRTLEVFRLTVYHPEKQSCEVFFDDDFHSLIDLESFGHNIETSWLIDRACDVLEDAAVRKRMMPVIKGLAEGVLRNGIDREDGGLDYECDRGVRNRTRSWWSQAEAVIGFYNRYQMFAKEAVKDNDQPQLFAAEEDETAMRKEQFEAAEDEAIGKRKEQFEATEDEAIGKRKEQFEAADYLQAAEQIWEFVKQSVIDKKHGEWIENIGAGNHVEPGQALVHLWKCPYHTGRLCMEMAKRLRS